MTTRKSLAPGALLAALVFAASACDCGPGTKRRFPSLEEGETQVDFGQVQLGVEQRRRLRIYNGGSATLNIAELFADAPFGVADEAPLAVGIGQEIELTVTFLPTVKDKRELGELRISSDDPERAQVRVSLAGRGIQAVATAVPNPVDFGDVWVGENKTVAVKLRNGGTNELTVVDVQFLDTTGDSISGDLSPLKVTVPAGGEVQTDLRFAPTQLSSSVPGGIRVELLPEQGGELLVAFKGRGIRSVPRLCFQLDGVGFETCTDPNAMAGTGNSIQVAFPPLCDALVSPPDSGFDACKGTPYQQGGKFYVKNEGNVPVEYSMRYVAALPSTSCDGGMPIPDFHFSNAPSPTAQQWEVPKVALAQLEETAPVNVVYAPEARCLNEAADQAQILWTRQGVGQELLRQPNTMIAFLNGQAKLPQAVADDRAFTGGAPQNVAFYGAGNKGSAEFAITSVELKHLVTGTPQGSCGSVDGGAPFVTCNGLHDDPLSWCYYFNWHADGGSPNGRDLEDRVVPVPGDGGVGLKQVGTIVFAPHPTPKPPSGQPVCIYSVTTTTDPFRPEIISKVQGTYSP